MVTVGIVKGNKLDEMLEKGLNLLGGLDRYIKKDSKVLIKPNLCTIKPWSTGATTDPLLVEELLKRLKKITNNIFIGESDHGTIDAEYAYHKLGFTELAKKYDVKLINLSDKNKLIEINNSNGYFFKKISLHEDLLSSDLIINLPLMKTNEISFVSLALKNMFGLLPERKKANFHSNIDLVIADINKFVKRSLIVLDGRYAMEGNGPIYGDLLKLDIMVFGDDPVALDSVVTQIMGFNPSEVDHISLSEKSGAGSSKNIELKGEKLDSVIKKFKKPSNIPLKRKITYLILENNYSGLIINSLGSQTRRLFER